MKKTTRALAASRISAVVLVLLIQFSAGICSNAATIEETFPKNAHGLYQMTGICTSEDARDALSQISPAICLTRVSTYYIDQNHQICLRAEDAAVMDSEAAQAEAWIQANIMGIVPDGTDVQTAVKDIADWLADHVTYYVEEGNRAYQSALPAFTEGRGLCTTYACAFDAMLHELPFDECGVVNYTAGTCHISTKTVYNASHCWSAACIDGQWLYYDICFYATGGRSSIYISGSADYTFGETDRVGTAH